MAKSMTCLIAIAFAVAPQITRTSAANAEWDRSVLPRPPELFQGVTKRTLEGSVAAFPQPVNAPPDAPNILLVLIDDAGFGNPSTFGGPIATPTLDKLAAEGLRHNRFHVTALCPPTRAALLSGRNHRAVGFGSISELIGGWPGYSTHGRQARRRSRRFSRPTVTTPPRLASGISRPTRSRGQQALLTAGPMRSASTISGDFSAEKTVSSIRFWLRTTRSSACRRKRIFISMTRWQSTRLPGFGIRKRRHRTNRSFYISRRAQVMRRIRCQRNGARSTKASLNKAGTSYARKRSHDRNSSA